MTYLTIQEKLTLLPHYLLRELDDYIDFLLHKYHLPVSHDRAESAGLFGICRGEIETVGDIISPSETEWEALK